MELYMEIDMELSGSTELCMELNGMILYGAIYMYIHVYMQFYMDVYMGLCMEFDMELWDSSSIIWNVWNNHLFYRSSG